MTPRTRPLLAAALPAALALTLCAGLAPAAAHPDRGHREPPTRIDLPDGFQPEGIDTRGPTAYLGSRVDGDVYAADLRTGRGRVLSQGDGTPAVGLELGRGSALWAAGGADGDVKVVDVRTGRTTATYELTPDPAPGESFVNDVVVTGRTAWVTDSLQARLYRVDQGRRGEATVSSLPLTGDWVQTAGVNNANGIETTPDGRALLVVQSSTGYLFRVDPTTGVAERVDLGDTLLTNGDGLTREGRTLFAVQNRLDRVAELRLSRDGRTGTLQRTLTSPELDVPTTVARWRDALYLPNARFTTPPTPETEYWVTRLEDR
ncbi:Sugar lactone lactonase YvrE [Nocardioides scoriae]|uniref:Sugar lactone lactonase YvrE n=1 Tax=Nocardioides scoriae TaxID=642780 RepID=A0A1H1M1E5_9ACTN|nr:superoxide dismutase [Nocardioides scoriae]SDR80460.1 Sugar lactone lactonase YvrE [Nocardioides scoriae]